MTAPLTPPHYFDALTGGDASMDFVAGAQQVISEFAGLPALCPRWVLADTPHVLELHLIDASADRTRLGLTATESVAELAFERDASGYVLVRALEAGEERFRGYLDRPYEDYDIWPPGAVFAPRRTEEAPGRIGKRGSWIVLDSRAWPGLAPFANASGFVLAEAEA